MNMNHKSLIDVIQDAVDNISKDYWKTDECPPVFVVSQLIKNETHEILLTIQHLGSSFSKVLFPQIDSNYGYESLLSEMKELYSLTM